MATWRSKSLGDSSRSWNLQQRPSLELRWFRIIKNPSLRTGPLIRSWCYFPLRDPEKILNATRGPRFTNPTDPQSILVGETKSSYAVSTPPNRSWTGKATIESGSDSDSILKLKLHCNSKKVFESQTRPTNFHCEIKEPILNRSWIESWLKIEFD